jgi:catechol 2,3-dioxygenase-like lactoylglutathione lyase family enzyme
MPAPAVEAITPVILVDAVEPCLSFWTDRLGFEKVVEVPAPTGGIQFAMLVKGSHTVMYQTWASVEAEHTGVAPKVAAGAISLFVVVPDIEAATSAMAGIPVAVARHRTFYGMEEFTVREPGGNLVTFAMRAG